MSVIDNPQGPDIQHRELCSSFCSNFYGKKTPKRIDILYDYVVNDSGGCMTKKKINYIPTYHLYEMKIKKSNV